MPPHHLASLPICNSTKVHEAKLVSKPTVHVGSFHFDTDYAGYGALSNVDFERGRRFTPGLRAAPVLQGRLSLRGGPACAHLGRRHSNSWWLLAFRAGCAGRRRQSCERRKPWGQVWTSARALHRKSAKAYSVLLLRRICAVRENVGGV